MKNAKWAIFFKNWRGFHVRALQKDIGSDGERINSNYSLLVSPSFPKLGPIHKVIYHALLKADGDYFAQKLQAFEFTDIYPLNRRETMEIAQDAIPFFRGNEHLLVSRFFLEGHHATNATEPDDPADPGASYRLLIQDAPAVVQWLNLFNFFSFENMTNLVRFHEMWTNLERLQRQCFEIIPVQNGPFEEYPFFLNTSGLKLRVPRPSRNSVTKSINSFLDRYQIERKDPFKLKREIGEYARSFFYGYSNAFEEFLGDLLRATVFDLSKFEFVQACEYCEHTFPFRKGKTYCSPLDGRECGKSIRNRRSYLRRISKRQRPTSYRI